MQSGLNTLISPENSNQLNLNENSSPLSQTIANHRNGIIAQLPTVQPDQNQGGMLSSALQGLGKLLGSHPNAANPQSNQSLQSGLTNLTNNKTNPQVNSDYNQQNPITTGQPSAYNSPFDLAKSMIGMNTSDNDDTLKAFMQKSGQTADPATTPYCAEFANGVLQSSGLKGTGSLAAKSFLNYGTPTNNPSKGDIVVLNRGNDPSLGHVGFYAGTDSKGNILVLGGNQGSKREVSIEAFDPGRVAGYRTPPTGKQIVQGIAPPNAHPELMSTMQGISGVESQGNYDTVSIPSKNGDRAYGKYQIMGNNIPQWTREVTGTPMTPKQFLANPAIQEKVAAYKINQTLNQGYSPQDAASIWFTGRPLDKAGMSVKDAYGTTNADYQRQFNKGYLKSKASMNSALNEIKEIPKEIDPKEIKEPIIPHDTYEETVRSLDKGRDDYS